MSILPTGSGAAADVLGRNTGVDAKIASMSPSGTRSSGMRLSEEERNRLKQACSDFESIFIHMMLRTMRESVPSDGLFSGGKGEEIFRDMLDEEYALRMSQTGQVGLSRLMYEQLTGERLSR